MSKLFLLRHLKSQWNEDNRFAGWADNPLSREGKEYAKEIAKGLIGERIDVVYTSPLVRNIETVIKIFENLRENKYPLFIRLDGGKMQRWGHFTDLNENDVPTYVSERLNERYYGKLQGLNKEDTIRQYGQEKVHLWRRAFNIAPPGGESLKDVYKRAVPFFKNHTERDLKNGKNVLVVASHNSLRALVKYVEKISDEKITDAELPFGALMQYEFNGRDYIKLVA